MPAPGKDPAAVAFGAQGRLERRTGKGCEDDEEAAVRSCEESGGGAVEKQFSLVRQYSAFVEQLYDAYGRSTSEAGVNRKTSWRPSEPRDLEWVTAYVCNQREYHAMGKIQDRLERAADEQAEAEQREAP